MTGAKKIGVGALSKLTPCLYTFHDSGSYSFEFRLKLPEKIPNTIHTTRGYVRYAVYCKFAETPQPEFLNERYE